MNHFDVSFHPYVLCLKTSFGTLEIRHLYFKYLFEFECIVCTCKFIEHLDKNRLSHLSQWKLNFGGAIFSWIFRSDSRVTCLLQSLQSSASFFPKCLIPILANVIFNKVFAKDFLTERADFCNHCCLDGCLMTTDEIIQRAKLVLKWWWLMA